MGNSPDSVDIDNPTPSNKTPTRQRIAIPEELRKTVQALYLQGLRISDITATTGVKLATVYKWINRFGWIRPRDNAKAILVQTAKRNIALANVPAVQAESDRVRKLLSSEAIALSEALAKEPVKDVAEMANTRERQGRAAVFKTVVDAASAVFDWDSQHSPGLIIVGEVERNEPEEADQTPTAIDIGGEVSGT